MAPSRACAGEDRGGHAFLGRSLLVVDEVEDLGAAALRAPLAAGNAPGDGVAAGHAAAHMRLSVSMVGPWPFGMNTSPTMQGRDGSRHNSRRAASVSSSRRRR